MTNFQRARGFISQAAPELLALAAALIFLVRLAMFAHTQWSVLDEGLYLYKGLLYTRGVYRPFQDYGPLTNQMPLAFMIPGAIQVLFGPGLRTGRTFAILLALAMLLAVYLTSRRLGGRWIAAGIVWAVALNPAMGKIYSMAISEGLIACLLMWVMFLSLGEKRPAWQLALAGALAGVMILIRINMLPVLPLLALYVFWQDGWKAALVSSLAGLAVLVLGHAIFWPNILRLWAYWLPERITPFLAAWRAPADAPPLWDPHPTLRGRVGSFLVAFRYHFLALAGTLTAWILWPPRKAWRADWEFRAAVFLSILLLSLSGLHIWASLGNDYCTDCYPIYVSFYAGLGLLLVSVCAKYWVRGRSRVRTFAAAAVVLALLAAFTYVHTAAISGLLSRSFYNELLATPIPRVRDMRIQPGTAELWQLFANKFHFQYEEILSASHSLAAILLGACAVGLLLALFWLLAKAIQATNPRFPALGGVVLFLLAGSILSPSALLGGSYQRYDCQTDVIRSFETAGSQLQKVIPAGSKIFWMGYAPVALLYLENVEIHPSQLNGDYSFHLGGDPAELSRYGWWDESLGRQWLNEADYILIYQKYFRGWLAEAMEAGNYEELSPTASVAPCLPDAQIRIFRSGP
jgi:hypothetical protein